MHRHWLNAKLHRATVTDRSVEYDGSLGVDLDLLDAAGMREHEMVQVYNVTNGARFETYLIGATRGSRDVVVNGAAARLAERGDRIIVVTSCWLTEAEAEHHHPTVVLLADDNTIREIRQTAPQGP